MKLAHCSDLHLDFLDSKQDVLDMAALLCTNAADTLCIAGDTLEVKWLRQAMNPNSGNFGKAQRFVKFFDVINNHYKRVLVIMGNHEHYSGHIFNTKDIMSDFFKMYKLTNCMVLDNDTVKIDGKVLFCGTGWTDMGGPTNYWFMRQGMNDFRLIKYGHYTRFTPDNAAAMHDAFLAKALHVRPDVILMHHAPAQASIAPQYQDDMLAAAYYSKSMQDTFLPKIDKPLVIIHGHTHHPVDYTVGRYIRVVSAPKGHAPIAQFKLGIVDI